MRPDKHLGVMSVPCCMKAPKAKNKLFITENELVTVVPLTVLSIFHSFGENLENEKKCISHSPKCWKIN